MKLTVRVGMVACALALVPGSASGNVIRPDTFADEPGSAPDNGNCTLREAVDSANRDVSEDDCARGNGADVIMLRRGVYQLSVPGVEMVGGTEVDNTVGDLDIGASGSSPLKIVGHRRGSTIDGGGLDRVFQVFDPGLATLERLSIENGAAVNRGGGISLFEDSRAKFVRTSVALNFASFGFGGVAVEPGAKATFVRSSVRDNFVPGSQVGGGVGVFGRAKMTKTKIISNEAGQAGGVAAMPGLGGDPPGSLKVRRSRVSGNEAADSGGGVRAYLGSVVNVSQSTVENNEAGTEGGGFSIDSARLVVSASTVFGNRAEDQGGGISLNGDPSTPGDLRVVNSTISGNAANQDGSGGAGEGGGIFGAAYGDKLVESSTITDNQADRGGGVAGPFVSGPDPVVLKGSIVAGNSASNSNPTNGPDCLFLGTFAGESAGHNLIGNDNGCSLDARGSDLFGNPGLEPLRSNGGPTKTHALKRRSRAIDAGPNDAPRKDQRGVRRRDPDIGSFERR